jgi:Streptomyces sporulation and cell division protein, SsgA
MANRHIVTRRIAFTYLDPDNDWQALGRISATLSWHRHDPLMVSLALPTHGKSRWVMARELLLDGLVCQYPGGIGDGCSYWVPWDDNNVVLELQLPHDDYITLRGRRSALASFLAATVYHEFADPFALETWYQFKQSGGFPNGGR